MKNKGIKISSAVYVLFVIAYLAYGLFLLDPSDAMGYAIVGIYIGLPVLSFIVSFMYGKSNLKLKWIVPVVLVVIELLVPYPVFASIELFSFLWALIPSLLGFGLGLGLLMYAKKREK